jgi:hypothetical protein
MKNNRINKRAKQARALFRLIDGIWNSFDKVPSFTGKARFMDKVLKARTHAHNLRWDLDRDLSEANDRRGS